MERIFVPQKQTELDHRDMSQKYRICIYENLYFSFRVEGGGDMYKLFSHKTIPRDCVALKKLQGD
jgi:hypothetical protein